MSRVGRAPRQAVFDARCLQDPAFARRGVGRHAAALLAARPDGMRVIGLVDPRLPELAPEVARQFDDLATNAYMAHRAVRGGGGPAVLVSASPMTHDATFTARLASDCRVFHAAVVYDFIPHDFPTLYLPTARDRLAYAVQRRWLAGADLFAAISQATADDLVRVIGADPARIVVTGAPVGHGLQSEEAARGSRHVLVVAGGDWRKSPAVVIAAHAKAAALQGARVKLVVAGAFGAGAQQAFAAIASDCGGDGGLVEVPGEIDDAALAGLYRQAGLVVCPSAAEGFSIPVAEGMAAGAVVLATDIPAHAELLPDPALRFSVNDTAALAGLLDHWWGREAAALVQAQRETAKRFVPAAVGARFWHPVQAALDAMPAAPRAGGARPRVAIMTPLPPDRSGVADYTAAACAELGQLADLHCFTPTPRPASVPHMATIQPITALPNVLPGFDAAVAVVGNSHFHTEIFRHALDYGGAIIAHDARMLGFYRVVLGEERALQEASRELKRPVQSPELDTWLSSERAAKALFLGEIARAASPMLVHSPVTCRLVQERYGVVPGYLPFSIYRPWQPAQLAPPARAAARERLEIDADEVLLVSFGHVHASKAPEECIWALATLRDWGMPARLCFAGTVIDLDNGCAALMQLAIRLGVERQVRFHGDFLAERSYGDYLVAADVAIQLRTYGHGGLSGAVLDCAAAGLPAVLNQGLYDTVLPPPGYTAAIPDALSPLLLAEAIADMRDAGLSRNGCEEERRQFSEQRSMAAYAGHLCAALGLETGQ